MLIVLLSVPAFFSTGTTEADVLYQGESEYNYITVISGKGYRALRLNNYKGWHSKSLDPETMMSKSYHDLFLLAQAIVRADRTLVLGNGAGTSMMQVRHFTDSAVDGVEIDPKLTDIGKDYFGLVLDEGMTVFHEDARTFLLNNEQAYDVIYIDIFAGSPYVPFHVATREFFGLVASALEEDGVVAINFPLYSLHEELDQWYLDTLSEAFPCLYFSKKGHMIYALKGERDIEEIRSAVAQCRHEELRKVGEGILRRLVKIQHPPGDRVFTDDFAPIERMTYRMLSDLRKTARARDVEPSSWLGGVRP
jgi:spermidine synthase